MVDLWYFQDGQYVGVVLAIVATGTSFSVVICPGLVCTRVSLLAGE